MGKENKNIQIGNFGEEHAERYLRKKGYEILERNIKLGHKEVDIIASFKGKTVFIEVKTRKPSIFGSAEDSITARKIKNLKRAMSMYLSAYDLDFDNVRLDLIAIDLDNNGNIANFKHIKDLF